MAGGDEPSVGADGDFSDDLFAFADNARDVSELGEVFGLEAPDQADWGGMVDESLSGLTNWARGERVERKLVGVSWMDKRS